MQKDFDFLMIIFLSVGIFVRFKLVQRKCGKKYKLTYILLGAVIAINNSICHHYTIGITNVFYDCTHLIGNS